MIDFRHSFFVECIDNLFVLGFAVKKHNKCYTKDGQNAHFDEEVGPIVVEISLYGFLGFFLGTLRGVGKEDALIIYLSVVYFGSYRGFRFNCLMTAREKSEHRNNNSAFIYH
jgi:hypothetical protein